jgi:hypothetical protein
MLFKATPETVCTPSDSIVVRKIDGDIVIVPLTATAVDGENATYTMNPTGQIIWEYLDGQRSLRAVALLLADRFNAPLSEVENDVLGFVDELARRGFLQFSNISWRSQQQWGG